METPYYSDYVWATQPYISEKLTNRLRDAFLALSEINPEHARILAVLGATSYLPAGHSDFKALEEIMQRRSLALSSEY